MKKRKIIYIILILCFLFLGTFAAYYILEQLKDTPLTLSVLDDQTITLEYGIDTPPTVTASYRDSQFSKENIYVDVTIEGEVDLSTLGTYVVTYTASNENETVSATHTYVIQDYTAPTITLYGGEFGYYSPGYTYIEAGFSASDNYDGDITDRVIRTETPTSVTYSVTDSFGNECSVTRNLICQDIVAPGLYLNGGDFLLIEKGSTFTDPGCLAFDDVNGDISANIMVTGSIDTNKYGKQYLTYTVADYSGNLSQIQRTVVVQEFTPPTLTLTGSKVFMLAGEAYVDPGYLAVDDVDGDVTANVTLSNTLDTNTPGIYTLTYTAIDSSLNTTSLTRTVYVCSPQSEELRINPTDKVVYLTFDDGPGPYTEQLLNTLDKYNIEPSLLEAEVTESVYMYDFNGLREKAKRLQELGVLISIDDFGSGYSSLNVLSKVSADIIKLDRQFLIEDEAGASPEFIKYLINMIKHLGYQIIAEGVETKEQAEMLKGANCDLVQGYYYARPMPMTDFRNFLHEFNDKSEE